MFGTKLDKLLGKADQFIADLEAGIEENRKAVAKNNDKVKATDEKAAKKIAKIEEQAVAKNEKVTQANKDLQAQNAKALRLIARLK